MIFNSLNEEQRRTLFALCKRMMIADARIRREETAFLDVLRQELKLPREPMADETFGWGNLNHFPDQRSQRILILGMAIMACVDDELHPKESTVLREVLDRLDLPEDVLDEIHYVAERQGELIKRINWMLEDVYAEEH